MGPTTNSCLDQAIDKKKWDEFGKKPPIPTSDLCQRVKKIESSNGWIETKVKQDSGAAISSPGEEIKECSIKTSLSSTNASSTGLVLELCKQSVKAEAIIERFNSDSIPSSGSTPTDESKDEGFEAERTPEWVLNKSMGYNQNPLQFDNEDWLPKIIDAVERDQQQPSPCYERVCAEFYDLPQVSAPADHTGLSGINEQLASHNNLNFSFSQDIYLNDWRTYWGMDFSEWEMQEPLSAQAVINSSVVTNSSVKACLIPSDQAPIGQFAMIQHRNNDQTFSDCTPLGSSEIDSIKCEITHASSFPSGAAYGQCVFSSSSNMVGIENSIPFGTPIPLVPLKTRNAGYVETQGSNVGFNTLSSSQDARFQGFGRKASMPALAVSKPISRPGTPAATTRAARKSRMARKRRSMVQNRSGAWSSSPCRRSLSNGHIKFNPPEESRGTISEKNLKFLLQKQLKPSDVGNLGRIVLPKKDAESRLPSLTAREGMTIVMEDLMTSRRWHLRYRFWPNNKSRMYLLANTSEFIKSHRLEEGDYMILYKDSLTGKHIISGKKASRTCEPNLCLPSPEKQAQEASQSYLGSETRSRKLKSACNSMSITQCKSQGQETKSRISRDATANTFSSEPSGSRSKRVKQDSSGNTRQSEAETGREDDGCMVQFKDDPLMEGIAKDFPAEFDGSELAQFPEIEPVDMAIEEILSLVDMPVSGIKSSKLSL